MRCACSEPQEPDHSGFFFGLEVAGSSIPQPPSLFGIQSTYCRLSPVYTSTFPMERLLQGSIKALPAHRLRVVGARTSRICYAAHHDQGRIQDAPAQPATYRRRIPTGCKPVCPPWPLACPRSQRQERDQSDFFFSLEVTGRSFPQPPSLFGKPSTYGRLSPVYTSTFFPMERLLQGSIKALPAHRLRIHVDIQVTGATCAPVDPYLRVACQ